MLVIIHARHTTVTQTQKVVSRLIDRTLLDMQDIRQVQIVLLRLLLGIFELNLSFNFLRIACHWLRVDWHKRMLPFVWFQGSWLRHRRLSRLFH